MHRNSKDKACTACLARLPERLVVLGFRGWLSGYETGDIACWEAVWNDYAREVGPERAKVLVGELAGLVRTLRHEGTRTIACYPRPCRLLCRDECMALGLIAGCQQEAWRAATTAARALAGSGGAEATLNSGRSYAAAMSAAGQKLQPVPLVAMAAFEERHTSKPLH